MKKEESAAVQLLSDLIQSCLFISTIETVVVDNWRLFSSSQQPQLGLAGCSWSPCSERIVIIITVIKQMQEKNLCKNADVEICKVAGRRCSAIDTSI